MNHLSARMAGLFVLTLATVAFAQTTRPAAHVPHFKPILSSQVVSNDSGGTRGAAFPWCDILVPTQAIATTTSPSPTLCWWVEKPLPYAYQCTIIDTTTQDSITNEPVHIPAVKTAGWQTIDLAKAGVTLKMDRKYQWNFSVAVGDAAGDAKPEVEPHSTLIQVVPAPADLAAALASAPDDRVQILADHGLWLDAAAAAVTANLKKDDAASRDTLQQLVDAFGRRKLAEKLKADAK